MFITKRSNGIYYIHYFNGQGKRTCVSTRARIKNEAFKFLSDFQNELHKKKISGVQPKTITEFLFDFIRYSESFHRPKTTKQFKSILREFSRYCENIPLTQITLPLIECYLQRKSKVSLYTSQKHLAYLRSAFNKAVKDKFLLSNPFQSIKNFKLPERQPLFFDEPSFQTLLRVIDQPDIKDVIIFGSKTGLRLMEILTLEWCQINFKEKYLILDNNQHTTKSKKVRTLPLTIEIMQILIKRERNRKNEFVFTYNERQFNPEFLSKRFKKYVIEAKLNPKLKFHSLRHTFASWLVQKGATIYEVSKLLGHSDIKTTEIYSHLRAEDLRSAIDKLNN